MKRIGLFPWWLPMIAAGALSASSVALCAQEAVAAPAGPAGTVPAEPNAQAPPTHEQVADSLMVHQRYQAAIEEYKKAPRNSVDAWNKMGVAYQLMYNVAEAGRCYEKALKLDPHNAVAFNNMGSVFMAEKAYSQAAKYFRKAAKQDATAALYRKNLGTALLAERKYEQGWSEYQQALALDPDIFSASGSVRVENPGTIRDRGAMNYYMAKGCLKAGQTDQAIEYLRQALNEGFTTPKKIIADAQFASLKDVPAFQKMMASQGVYLTTPGAHSTIQ